MSSNSEHLFGAPVVAATLSPLVSNITRVRSVGVAWVPSRVIGINCRKTNEPIRSCVVHPPTALANKYVGRKDTAVLCRSQGYSSSVAQVTHGYLPLLVVYLFPD